MRKILNGRWLAIVAASFKLCSPAADLNTLRQLDEIDCSIEVAELLHTNDVGRHQRTMSGFGRFVAEYEKQKSGDPKIYKIGERNIPQASISTHVAIWRGILKGTQNSLQRAEAHYTANMSDLRAKREALLRSANLKAGVCEIHGIKLKASKVRAVYGFPRPLPNGYREARLTKFRNSDSPISAGCVQTDHSPVVISRDVCSECVKTRREWLKKHHRR